MLKVICLIFSLIQESPLPKLPCDQLAPLKQSVMGDSVCLTQQQFESLFVLRRFFFFFSVKQKADFLELLSLAPVLPWEATWNKFVLCAYDNFYILPSCPFSTFLQVEHPYFFQLCSSFGDLLKRDPWVDDQKAISPVVVI